MRKAALLAMIALGGSQPAIADIVRRSALPEPLWGTWVSNDGNCGDASPIVVSGKNYANSGLQCDIRAISETAGAKGAVYSARMQCSKQPAQKSLILAPTDATHFLAGASFESLKTFRRCESSLPSAR